MWEAMTTVGNTVGTPVAWAGLLLSAAVLLVVLTSVTLCFMSMGADPDRRAHVLALLARLNEQLAALRGGRKATGPTAADGDKAVEAGSAVDDG